MLCTTGEHSFHNQVCCANVYSSYSTAWVLVGECCAFLGERERVNVVATVELCFAVVCSVAMTNNL